MRQIRRTFFIVFFLFLSATSWSSSPSLVGIEGDPFIVDLRYNSDDNFLHKNVYKQFQVSECLVHPDMAKALERLKPMLQAKKLKLVMWDCFRPIEVQREMWKLVPDDNFVADPKKGSSHNRGVAVDVTLADSNGELLPMPTGFDDFSPRAAPSYRCERDERRKCKNRDLLIGLMEDAGLKPIATEWWHYSIPNAENYPISSVARSSTISVTSGGR